MDRFYYVQLVDKEPELAIKQSNFNSNPWKHKF